ERRLEFAQPSRTHRGRQASKGWWQQEQRLSPAWRRGKIRAGDLGALFNPDRVVLVRIPPESQPRRWHRRSYRHLLLVAQRLDRIDPCGPPRRQIARRQSDQRQERRDAANRQRIARADAIQQRVDEALRSKRGKNSAEQPRDKRQQRLAHDQTSNRPCP